MRSPNSIALIKRLLGITGLRLAGAGATFLFSFLIARLLSAEDAGRMFWAIAVTSFLAVVARLGLDKGFLKAGAQLSQSYAPQLAAMMVLRKYRSVILGFSLALTALLALYGLQIDTTLGWHQNALALVIAGLAIPGISLTIVGSSATIGSGLVRRGTTLASLTPAFVALTLLSVAWMAGAPINLFTFSASYSAGWLLSAAILLSPNPRAGSQPVATVDRSTWSAETVWFAIIGISNTIEQWAPALIAGALLSPLDSANFALCARLIAVVQLIMVAATSTYAHMYAAANPDSLDALVRKAVRSLLIVGTPVIGGLFLLAPAALSVFGATFAAADGILRIMLFGQIINMGMGTFSVLLMMRSRVKTVALAFLASSLAQILVALLAAHMGSVRMLAASSVMAIAVHSVTCFVIYLRGARQP